MQGLRVSRFQITALTFLFVVLLLAFASPYVLRWRLADSERSAAQEIRGIDKAVKAYIAERGTAPAALSSLKGRIAPALSCDAPSCVYIGYRFQYSASPESSKPRYSITAQPLSPTTGARSYYMDETGVLRYTKENRAATSGDPPLQ